MSITPTTGRGGDAAEDVDAGRSIARTARARRAASAPLMLLDLGATRILGVVYMLYAPLGMPYRYDTGK